MDHATVKDKLIAVLQEIQAVSDLECPPLTGTIKPIESIPKFDSKVWPVATTILASQIGASIPNDVNIFIDDSNKIPRSIDEAAAFVCKLLEQQDEMEGEAV